MFHKLAHLFRWNKGYIVSTTDRQNIIWIGFKCLKCGKISGIHPSIIPPTDEQFKC